MPTSIEPGSQPTAPPATMTNQGEPPSYQATMSADKKPSKRSTIKTGIGKALAFVPRTASTVVNGALWGGYYLSVMTLTGFAAAGGAVYGAIKIGVDYVNSREHNKTLFEYTITPAKATFNELAEVYNDFSEHTSEIIFAGAVVVATVTAMIAGIKNSSNSDHHTNNGGYNGYYGRCHGGYYGGVLDSYIWGRNNTTVIHHHHNDYYPRGNLAYSSSHNATNDDNEPSYFATLLRPYKFATNFGATVMDRTTKFINGGQPADNS